MAEPTAIIPDKGIRPGFNETGSTINRRLFVKKVAGGAEDSIETAGDGERAIGVLLEDALDDDRADVQIEGQAIVTAAGALARGVDVASDAAGKATTAASNDIVLGITRSASGGADEDIEIELAGPLGGNVAP